MTDLRRAAEMALNVLENESPRRSVEQYLLEQHAITFLKKALAQPEQDKRKWIELTRKEIRRAEDMHLRACHSQWEAWTEGVQDFARAIQAKLKEKNYGL